MALLSRLSFRVEPDPFNCRRIAFSLNSGSECAVSALGMGSRAAPVTAPLLVKGVMRGCRVTCLAIAAEAFRETLGGVPRSTETIGLNE